MLCSVLLQDRTMQLPPTYWVFVPCVALVLRRLVSMLSASRPAIELPRVRTRSAKAFRRSRQLESWTFQSSRSTPSGKRNFLFLHGSKHWGSVQYGMSSGPRYSMAMSSGWHALLDRTLTRPPRFWDRSVVSELSWFCLTWNLCRFPGFARHIETRLSDTLYNECPLLYDMVTSIWGQSVTLPRWSNIHHDLITWVWSLLYGIVAMGFIETLFYALNRHRRSMEISGNFGDCMKGRIRFMTAITSAYAHAYQVTCLSRHVLQSRVWTAASRVPMSDTRSYHKTRKRQWLPMTCQQYWRVYSPCQWWNLGWMGCYRPISSWKSRCYVWFGHDHRGFFLFVQVPELTPTTPLKCRLLSRDCPFSGPLARLPVMRIREFIMTPKYAGGVCLGTIEARAHVQLALACQQLMLKVQHRLWSPM